MRTFEKKIGKYKFQVSQMSGLSGIKFMTALFALTNAEALFGMVQGATTMMKDQLEKNKTANLEEIKSDLLKANFGANILQAVCHILPNIEEEKLIKIIDMATENNVFVLGEKGNPEIVDCGKLLNTFDLIALVLFVIEINFFS